ncbi:D-aminoacyl-tRNA deacylase [Halosimplex aquaticum]|uniref:D-aminoacyl-tRNA deacylase n=1 Tax=Halosimplex aquaticum TaxID=3026162 RepID=A0ABD5Y4A1_9EURY|nr:D-aminoacyl-tRNA deacylase [Halosimplex aquaticum]
MLAVVVSRADSASVHVGERLRDLADWTEHADGTRPDADGGGTVFRTDAVELREFDDLHLNLADAGDAFGRVDDEETVREPDLLVFASRHAGETDELLTAHPTGNFGPAEYGGETGHFARTCPNAHSRVVEALESHAPPGYEVGIECTHHGPTEVGVPSMFVEVGSDEPQWDDPDAAEAVARAILSLREVAPDAPTENGRRRHLVGFGGGHYAPRFERIVRETDWAVGHVAADWCLDAMGDPDANRDVIRRAFEASAADYAVVEGDRPGLREVVADLGYRAVGETWVRETSGVPLALVDVVEERLAAVDEGVRFGDSAVGYGRDPDRGDLSVVDLPEELVAAAEGVDPDATRAAVEAATVAYETTEGGTRLGRRAVVDADHDGDALVDELAGVLGERYDSVEREAGTVVARETAFDPERARTLGIPDGPKFGKLAEGEAVTVDGDRIDPSVVHVDREHRFPVGDLLS